MKRLSLLCFILLFCMLLPAQRRTSDACVCLVITPHTGFARMNFNDLELDREQSILPERRMLGTAWGTDLTLHRKSGIYYGLGYAHFSSTDIPAKLLPKQPWDRKGGWVESESLAATFGVMLLRPSLYWRAMIDGSIAHLWTQGEMGFASHDVRMDHRSMAASISPSIAYLITDNLALGLKGSYTWSAYTEDFLFHSEAQEEQTRESRKLSNKLLTAQVSLSYLVGKEFRVRGS